MEVRVGCAGSDGVHKVPGGRPLVRHGDHAEVCVPPGAQQVDQVLKRGERDPSLLHAWHPQTATRLAGDLGQVVRRHVPALVLQSPNRASQNVSVVRAL